MQDNADDVDKKGRFPHEAINAMKEFKLMGHIFQKILVVLDVI